MSVYALLGEIATSLATSYIGIAILIGIIKIEKCILVDSFLGAIHEVSGIVRCPEIPAFTLYS